MKVTLAKAVRLPGRALSRQGQMIEVDEGELSILERVGAVAVDKPVNNVTVTEPAHTDTPTETAPEGAVRPAKTASAEKWAEYLTTKGIDPKGLSKREMIAAVS